MKTPLFLCVSILCSSWATERAVAQQPVVTPTTPAPAVTETSAPTAPLPAPNRIIYGQRLPTPEELRNVASAQGLTLERVEQTSTQIVGVFQNANGQTEVISYQVLPASGVAPGQTVPTTVVPATGTTTTTTVIYDTPRVVYYDPYYWPWYSPVRVGIGIGWGYRGGGYYRGGGWHGGGWHGGGGWHHGGHR